MSYQEPIVTDITQGLGLRTPPPAIRDVRVLLSPLMQPGLESFAVGYTEVPVGERGSKHHHDQAEIWLFFAGQGRATVGEREIDTTPGTVVYTPPGVDHQFFNAGDEPVRLFFLYVPSGAEQFVIDGLFR